jgi:NAD(P)H-hydrate epimerase
MKKIKSTLSAQEARDLDIYIQKKFAISVLILMENAGKAIFTEALKIAKRGKRIAVLCGKGNNGGDGFVTARHLLASGFKPAVFLAGDIHEVKEEAGINLTILRKLKQKIIEVNKNNFKRVKKEILKCDLIIDALLGVGLKGEVRGLIRELIGLINRAKGFILSIDIPSGLDATSGRVLGACDKADKTITFIRKKTGMLKKQGPRYCGKVIVRDLGVPL